MEQPQQKYSQFKGQPRLPKFAVPKRYDLKLIPDLVTCKFAGTVDISVDIVSDTEFLVFNAADLAIDRKSVRFTPQNGSKVLEASEVELFEADEIVVVEFPESLPIGTGVLSIAFDGTLNEDMKGFYWRTYDHNGEKKNMAATTFEPSFARRCFPCWDEPACKATFKITVDVPSDLVALSNMPVVEESLHGSMKTVHYQESPVMSTYLVAVVVGLFDFIEDETSDGVKVRVYCEADKIHQGKFSLDLAVKTLELFTEYFADPYALPKMDMVVVPNFMSGAMENYGLVTYREQALLYDDKHSAASNKQMVAIAVTHELAHQWFGNLVTLEWWTHLWLNEGFATWASYLATDKIFPDWKIWTQFLEDSTKEGLRLDALAESHPIEVEVNHVEEMGEIFDAISYLKGASVIRMLQSYLGAECFQRALVSYVKKYACSNAKTEDLWAALEEESGEPVNKLMNSWTKQQGFPVVSVKLKDQNLELEQSQFLLGGSHGDGQWFVPITLCYGSYDSRKNFLLETKTDMVGLELGDWIKVNIDQAGFYRVKYDDTLMEKLRHAIETKELSAIDRFGILDDSYALCMACKEPLSSLLTLMGSYREEPDYTVISNLIQISGKISRIVADAAPEFLVYLDHFFIDLFRHSTERLGWDPKEGESHLDAMLRGELLLAMVCYGLDATLNEAKRRFDAFLKDKSTPLLPPDLRKTAYKAVMRNVSTSNRSGYESLLKVYRETDLSEEKTRILASAASCPDPGIVTEVLNFLLTPEVRSQDVIFGARVGIKGREAAWTWLKSNWEGISNRWSSGLVRYLIGAIVSPFACYEKASEVQEFLASRTKPEIKRTVKQSIERININANWVQNIQNEKQRLSEVIKDLTQKTDI